MLGNLAFFTLLACNLDSSLSTRNDPPEVALASPADGSSVVAGEVLFLAAISDDITPLEDLVIVFASDPQGGLDGVLESRAGGVQFVTDELEVGTHTVTVRVTDPGAEIGQDSMVLEVLPNTPPTVTILAPEDDDALAYGSTPEMWVEVSDSTEADLVDLVLTWSVDDTPEDSESRPDADGLASYSFEGLEPGFHVLGCTVTDTGGEQTSSSVAVEVLLPDEDGDGFITDRLGGEDCDDSDDSVHPNAIEVCDDLDVDEDCNGLADDEDPAVTDPLALWPDGDEDGFGDGASPLWSCEAENGVDNGEDCNDADPDTNPDAAEICNDGLDNNCDEVWDNCRYDGEINLYSADAAIYGAGEADRSSSSLDAGDLDGDGIGDLLIGAYLNSDAGKQAGSVHVSLGPHLGESVLGSGEPAWTGELKYANAGYTVAIVGDMDGDGLAEFAAGAPYDNGNGTSNDNHDAGRAYLFAGGSLTGGLLENEDSWTGPESGDNLGIFVSGAGDVDGDGLADLLLGSSNDSSLYSDGGAAYLMLGPARVSGKIEGAYDARFRPEGTDDELGSVLGTAGDVNGDGLDDFLLSAPNRDDLNSRSGVVYLILGDNASHWSGISQRVNSAHARIRGHQENLLAGTALESVGDIDGDGHGDLIIGAASTSDPGSAFLVRGPLTGDISLGNADIHFQGGQDGSSIGHALAAGDVDGDGELDLLIGGYTYDEANEYGQATLLHGPLLSLGPEVDMDLGQDATWEGPNKRDWLGADLEMHDLDSDGRDELVLGVPRDDSEETDGGGAYVFAGQGL